MDFDTLKGTVQGYFDRAFMEVAEKDYENPLANSDYGIKTKLAPNSGTFVQFRSFGDRRNAVNFCAPPAPCRF